MFGRDRSSLFQQSEFAKMLPHERIAALGTLENQSDRRARQPPGNPRNVLFQHAHHGRHGVHVDGEIRLISRRHAKAGKGGRLEELRQHSEVFFGVFEIGRMKLRVRIAIDSPPDLAPLRVHRGVVSAEERAAADGEIRVIAGKGLVAVHENQKPIVGEVELLFGCLHIHASDSLLNLVKEFITTPSLALSVNRRERRLAGERYDRLAALEQVRQRDFPLELALVLRIHGG